MWALEGVLRVIKAKLQEKIGEDKRINFSIYPLDPPNEIAWRDDMRPLFKACFSAGIAFAAFISCREYLWQQPRFQEYRECVLWNRETPHRYSAIVIAFLRANRGHPFRDSILQMLKQGHLKQVNVPFLQDVAHPFEKKLDAFAGSRFVLSHIAAASQQPQAISAVPPATAVSVVAANRPD